MKILITGGSGFIAGRLAKHLAKNNDIFLVSRNKNLQIKKLKKVKIKHINWENQSNINELCKDIDTVIHTAGMNAKNCLLNPEYANRFNGYRSLDLINASINNKVKNFFYLSTAHVYCSPLIGDINENSKTTNKHPYATSNLLGEKFLTEAILSSHIKGNVIRLSNVYGTPIHNKTNCWDLVMQDICLQAIKNKKIILKSNGMQKRDFIPMESLCIFFEKILNKEIKITENIVNLGSGISQTIYDIALFVQNRTEKKFGFFPKIFANEKDKKNTNKDLIFNSKFNFISSLELELNKYKEVDGILNFCNINFNN